MSHIKNKDSKIELVLRKALWEKGYRYRKNYKELPGRPDIAITKFKIAIFCDSEFFHGKDWDKLKLRLENGNNGTYWIKKITRNMQRDRGNEQALRYRDWTVLRFWGEDILKHTESCIEAVNEAVLEQIIGSSILDNPLTDSEYEECAKTD